MSLWTFTGQLASPDSSGEEDSDDDDENNKSNQSFNDPTPDQVNFSYFLKGIL